MWSFLPCDGSPSQVGGGDAVHGQHDAFGAFQACTGAGHAQHSTRDRHLALGDERVFHLEIRAPPSGQHQRRWPDAVGPIPQRH